MNLIVTQKTVYGNTLWYPACEISKQFCSLLSVKTLTFVQLTQIKNMGYEIVVTTETKRF
jgi:hypothetical protein